MADMLEERAAQAKLNPDRDRWYGLRVGDDVVEKAFGMSCAGTVKRLKLMDNNGCILTTDRGDFNAVCEYCIIVTKVEDKACPVTPAS